MEAHDFVVEIESERIKKKKTLTLNYKILKKKKDKQGTEAGKNGSEIVEVI